MSFISKVDLKYKILAKNIEYDVSFKLTTEYKKDIEQDITKEFCKAIKQALNLESNIELTNSIIESDTNFCYTEMYGKVDAKSVYQYLKKNLDLSKVVEDVYLLIRETELTGDSSHDINLIGQNTIFYGKLN